MAAQVVDFIESGLSSEDIIKKFVDPKIDSESAEETFSDEIHIISQPLAYRKGLSIDIPEVYRLLNSSYNAEIEGGEAFRSGKAVSIESVMELFEDDFYEWMVVEAPSGKGVELDGIILGACCYSTKGISRRNG